MDNKNKVSCGSIYEAEHKKVKSFDFGTQAGIDADARGTMQGQSFEGFSLVLSENKQTPSSNTTVIGVRTSTVGELRHERGSETGRRIHLLLTKLEIR